MEISTRFLTAGALVVFTVVVLPAANQVPACFADGLSVPLSHGTVAAGLHRVRYDFGSIDRLETPTVRHTFTLTNDAKTPIQIARIQPSCGCTTALIGGSTRQNGVTIAPGGSVEVDVSVDLSEVHGAIAQKFIWALLPDVPDPAFTIELDATIKPNTLFDPSVVDFGSTQAHTQRILRINAQLDSRLCVRGEAPALVSSNPSITVTALPVDHLAVTASTKMVHQAYLATLAADAPLGLITGTLGFTPQRGLAPKYFGALTSTTAALAGQVFGAISVSQGALVFGVVPTHAAATRHITILANSNSVLAGLHVESALDSLTASLAPDFHTAGNRVTRDLIISLNPTKGPAEIRTFVTITTADGQRLTLPVMVYVSAP